MTKISESSQTYGVNPETGKAERITLSEKVEPIEGNPNIGEEESGGIQRAKEKTGDFMDEAKKTFKGMGESIQHKGHEIKEFFMEKEKDIMSKIRKPESQKEHEEAMEKFNEAKEQQQAATSDFQEGMQHEQQSIGAKMNEKEREVKEKAAKMFK